MDKEDYYYPEYVNRFGKLGSLLRMWFKPLQGIFGDIVSYEEDSPPKTDGDEKKNTDTEQNVPYEPVNQDHIQAHIPRYENNHDQPAAIVIGSSPGHLIEIDHMDPYVREGQESFTKTMMGASRVGFGHDLDAKNNALKGFVQENSMRLLSPGQNKIITVMKIDESNFADQNRQPQAKDLNFDQA